MKTFHNEILNDVKECSNECQTVHNGSSINLQWKKWFYSIQIKATALKLFHIWFVFFKILHLQC